MTFALVLLGARVTVPLVLMAGALLLVLVVPKERP